MNWYFSRGLIGFCSSMSVYGVTRGYRAQNIRDKDTLTSGRIANGIFNGLLYAVPIVNIGPTIRLINRLEIDYKGLNPNDYKDNYREFIGECDDTI